MIDGFRYGFFGQSDINPFYSLGIVLTFLVGLSILAIHLLKRGYKLRS
jgi:ABC-2 type transport system permease protein